MRECRLNTHILTNNRDRFVWVDDFTLSAVVAVHTEERLPSWVEVRSVRELETVLGYVYGGMPLLLEELDQLLHAPGSTMWVLSIPPCLIDSHPDSREHILQYVLSKALNAECVPQNECEPFDYGPDLQLLLKDTITPGVLLA